MYRNDSSPLNPGLDRETTTIASMRKASSPNPIPPQPSATKKWIKHAGHCLTSIPIPLSRTVSRTILDGFEQTQWKRFHHEELLQLHLRMPQRVFNLTAIYKNTIFIRGNIKRKPHHVFLLLGSIEANTLRSNSTRLTSTRFVLRPCKNHQPSNHISCPNAWSTIVAKRRWRSGSCSP